MRRFANRVIGRMTVFVHANKRVLICGSVSFAKPHYPKALSRLRVFADLDIIPFLDKFTTVPSTQVLASEDHYLAAR
jgi:hypothetical protein